MLFLHFEFESKYCLVSEKICKNSHWTNEKRYEISLRYVTSRKMNVPDLTKKKEFLNKVSCVCTVICQRYE